MASTNGTGDKTAVQRVVELREGHLDFWRARWDAVTKRANFLEGDRYRINHEDRKDRRLVQVRGQETQDTNRHVAAKATERPLNIQARPIDSEDDPTSAEMAVALIQHEMDNPWKMFHDVYEEAIQSACDTGLGVLWMDWHPDQGPFGEIFYRHLNVVRSELMWDPAYHPHHPLCNWLMYKTRVNVDRARKMYNAPWIQPDRDARSSYGTLRSGQPIMRAADGRGLHTLDYKDDRATLWFCWYKNDQTLGPAEEVDRRVLSKGERYMTCATEDCGYRSESAEVMGEKSFPPFMPGSCPMCGGDLERIDAKATDQEQLAYTNGHRLVIVAPLSTSPNDQPVYDGNWPIPEARGFPGLFIRRYNKPDEPLPPCDTDLMWDQQLAADQLRTMAIQRVFEHRLFWEIPKTGITDVHGRRWAPRDDNFGLLYRDHSLNFDTSIKTHSGTGLDPHFEQIFGIVEGALTRYRPALDIGPAEDSTRAIPVGTIERINANAEISTAHFNRTKSREVSRFAGVLWDYIRATYTPNRLARLNIDGLNIIMGLHGDELADFDFVIEDAPNFTGIEKARADAANWAMQVVTNPQTLPFFDILAEVQQLPASIVTKIQKRLEELKAEAAEAEEAGMLPGDGLGGPEGEEGGEVGLPPPPGLDEDQGAGIEPAPLS